MLFNNFAQGRPPSLWLFAALFSNLEIMRGDVPCEKKKELWLSQPQ